MKTILTFLVLTIFLFTSCTQLTEKQDLCGIERHPFQAFQPLNFGDVRLIKMIEAAESGFFLILQGVNPRVVKLSANFSIEWSQTYSLEAEGIDFSEQEDGKLSLLLRKFPPDEANYLLISLNEEGKMSNEREIGLQDKPDINTFFHADGEILLLAGNVNDGFRDGARYVAQLDADFNLEWAEVSEEDENTYTHIFREGENSFSLLSQPGRFGFSNKINFFRLDLDERLEELPFSAESKSGRSNIVFKRTIGSEKLFATDFLDDSFETNTQIALVDDDGKIFSDIAVSNSGSLLTGDVIKVDDGFVISGISMLCSELEAPLYLAKTDEKGNIEWERMYGGTFSLTQRIFENEDGGYLILATQVTGFGSEIGNLVTLEVDREGRPK